MQLSNSKVEDIRLTVEENLTENKNWSENENEAKTKIADKEDNYVKDLTKINQLMNETEQHLIILEDILPNISKSNIENIQGISNIQEIRTIGDISFSAFTIIKSSQSSFKRDIICTINNQPHIYKFTIPEIKNLSNPIDLNCITLCHTKKPRGSFNKIIRPSIYGTSDSVSYKHFKGLNSNIYYEAIDSIAKQKNQWNAIKHNSKDIECNDFIEIPYLTRHKTFFALKSGGIALYSKLNNNSSEIDEVNQDEIKEITEIFTRQDNNFVEFQAITLDTTNENSPYLYALDKEVPSNNLYKIYLNQDFTFKTSSDYTKIPASNILVNNTFKRIFYNNLIIKYNHNNLIQSSINMTKNHEIYLIGTSTDILDTETFSDPKINIYTGNFISNNFNSESLILNLTKIVPNDFNFTTLNNKDKNDNSKLKKNMFDKDVSNDINSNISLINLIKQNSDINYINEYINFAIDDTTNYIYFLIRNKIYYYPINNINDCKEKNCLINFVTTNTKTDIDKLFEKLNNTIKKLNYNRDILANYLYLEDNAGLQSRLISLDTALNNLNILKKNEDTIIANKKITSIENNSISFQYLMWIILVLSSIIILILNYINPNLIPIQFIIIYITIITIIILTNLYFNK